MNEQQCINYERVAEAIAYIREHFREQPDLDEVAQQVFMSPYHFQRVFSKWAGTSPKKFLRYTTLEYAKSILRRNGASVFDAAFEAGLSGTGRLHDLFVGIEGMTPGEFRHGGKGLSINYSFQYSPFGKILIASTTKGVCHLSFLENDDEALHELRSGFPNAVFTNTNDALQAAALSFFNGNMNIEKLRLHLKATPFQLKVWDALLKIPAGALATYKDIAGSIDHPGASRAVGTAIGQNPVAFIIPCHRVIRGSGALGGYKWNTDRKTAIIGWEGLQLTGI